MHREHYQNEVNRAYIEAIYFTEAGPDSEIDTDCRISEKSLSACNRACNAFVDQLIDNGLFKKALDVMTPDQIGRDFWLTRNGHGVGFWDRGFGELGEKLSNVAKYFGECYAYRGDDGFMHIDGGKL